MIRKGSYFIGLPPRVYELPSVSGGIRTPICRATTERVTIVTTDTNMFWVTLSLTHRGTTRTINQFHLRNFTHPRWLGRRITN